jgi:hypothetical protein
VREDLDVSVRWDVKGAGWICPLTFCCNIFCPLVLGVKGESLGHDL